MSATPPLAAFHQDPRRLACAQAVFHLWRERRGDEAFAAGFLEPHAPATAAPGTCGALLAARTLAPDLAPELEHEFRRRFGGCRCRDLCDPEVHPCRDRVAFACEALARGAPVA